MVQSLVIRCAPLELEALHRSLSASEARKIKALARWIAEFDAAPDKAAVAERAKAELEPLGVRGVSVPSLYRKAQLWREGGISAIVDGRVLRRTGAEGLAANSDFRDFWQTLLLSNRRKSRPAYRELFMRLANGEHIPGFGTWRDIWLAEHGVRPAEGDRCPYRAYSDVPKGWTERNLMRLKPDKFALAAARRGLGEAKMQALPAVRRTRAGLAPMQCVMVDDMWHEAKVAWEGNIRAERVVELSAMDVLTGHVVSWFAKPVVREGDGPRQTLKQEWMRYLMAYLLCEVGITDAGMTVLGEHGTAAADEDLARALSEVSGGRVEFRAGGILAGPLAKGLPAGRPHGNPRFKGMLEAFHGTLKNQLGNVRGLVGGGRGMEPEEAYGMDRLDNMYRAMAQRLEKSKPGILGRLRLPYMQFGDFVELVGDAYRVLDARTDHQMEGWRDCGFETGEFRVFRDSPWTPATALDTLPPDIAAAYRRGIADGTVEYRARRMSPGEAWASRAAELRTLDPVAAVVIMGEGLAKTCVCDNRLTLRYRDTSLRLRCDVAGVLDGGRTLLERGREYRVWVNPLTPDKAFVADGQGRYMGVAKVMQPGGYVDGESVGRALGIRAEALAAERRRLGAYTLRRQEEAAEDLRHNALEILGRDPAEDEARGAAAEIVADRSARRNGRVALDDLVGAGSAPADAGSLDDIL